MVLGHVHRRQSAASPQKGALATPNGHSSTLTMFKKSMLTFPSSSAGKNGSSLADDKDYNTEDETVVDEEQGNILMHIISQLRPGADLSRVTLPTFFLEPRSMLERITNFMAHPEVFLSIPEIEDPVQRFVAVVKFYLSGWHIKPPGVKKPLNPILGEIFTGYWEYPDGTKGYYISEQTSHHPPKSSYFFAAPEHHIRIDGTLKPRSKFLGNSAASMMEGLAVLRFMNHKERYFVTQPNMYARGILFGKMKYELGDHSFVRCPETGLMADLEFKTKGYFSGMYNAIGGFIKDTKTDKNLYELSGLWSGEMFIKDLSTGKKEPLFDATHAKETPPSARPIEEQGEIESQKLWSKVNQAIRQRDQNAATDEKSIIENAQRQRAAKRLDDGVDWKPSLFREVHGGPGGSEEGEEDLDWIMKTDVKWTTPEEIIKQILDIHPILPGQQADPKFAIPARKLTESAPDQAAEPPSKAVPEPAASSPAPTPSAPADSIRSKDETLASSGAIAQAPSPPTDPSAPSLPPSVSVVQNTEPLPQAGPNPLVTSDPVNRAISPPVNGLLINARTGNDDLQRPMTHHQSISAGDLPYHETHKVKSPPNPNEQMIDSMRKLKVGEPKEQAAVLHEGKPNPMVIDPLATPKAKPRDDKEVDREVLSPSLQRMDSETHEIDEFVDAES